METLMEWLIEQDLVWMFFLIVFCPHLVEIVKLFKKSPIERVLEKIMDDMKRSIDNLTKETARLSNSISVMIGISKGGKRY